MNSLIRKLLVLSGGLAAIAASGASAASSDGSPNILLIVADDLGYNDVGFQGCRDIPTPNIDRLAGSGTRCSSGYVSYPVCSPSRAGFLTGRYQQRFGYEFNPAYNPADPIQGLPLSEVTLGDALRKAGYTTGIVGKWHQGTHPQFHPNRRGFDEFFGFLGGGHRYLAGVSGIVEIGAGKKAKAGGDAESNAPMMRNTVVVPEEGELTTRLGAESAAFINHHARDAKPWFLYMAFNAPHTPLQARTDLLERFSGIADEKRRTYAAMVTALDESIGRAIAALEAGGVRERTLIFFFSDNGGPMTKRNANTSRNTPLRGQKGDVFEGGVRVPFIVSWPGSVPAGRTYDFPVSSLDVFPTALAAAHSKPDPKRSLDGVDLRPYLNGTKKTAPHARLFWRMDGGEAFAVREGDWKWMRTYDNPPELYNLKDDLGETRNIATTHPEIAARLAAASEAWNRTLMTPIWKNNPFGGMINRTGPVGAPSAP
jgi:arylsulfatase A-like enzyme